MRYGDDISYNILITSKSNGIKFTSIILVKLNELIQIFCSIENRLKILGVISLKVNKIFIVFISIFLVLIVGCSNGIKNAGDKIVVEKQINGEDKYELYNEIKDSKDVQNAKNILNSIKWENAAVSMVHPPEYKFHFEDTNSKTSGASYELWISPNKDKIELVIDGKVKYVQLDKEKSEKLFKIITGKNLGEI